MGLHSLRGYFRQLPAMNLEQMARKCLRPCTDPNTKQRVRLTYTRRVHELAPWVPDWCPPIPVRYAWRRIDARTLFSMAWQKGDREAAFYYGLLFAHGMGGPSDLPCARAMIEQARRNGSAIAEVYSRACLFARKNPIQGFSAAECLLLKLVAGSCGQAPQDYDWLVWILLCFYCEQGSALANELLHSWQHDQNRMQELSDSR